MFLKQTILSILFLCCIFTVHAQITASDTAGCAPFPPVQFTAPPGVTSPIWDFDDGVSGITVLNPTHAFSNPGTYQVKLFDGLTFIDSITIRVFSNPNADFNGSPQSGCIGLNVSFTDLSIGTGTANIVTWEWDFGDGGTDATNNPDPNYTYTLAGSFAVSLKILDSNGCESSTTKPGYISTSIPPTAILTHTPSPAVACNPPLDVNFSAASSFTNSTTGGGLTYSWDFGDLTSSTLVVPPTKTYANNGIYNVVLEVTDNNGCTSSANTTVSIDNPQASFEAQGAINDTICPAATFINHSSPGVYFWTFGDGSPPFAGTNTTVDHTYQNPGTYNVRLQVFAGGCTDDTTITVIVEEIVADFDLLPTYSCEAPYNVQFNDASINAATWDWDFGDGNSDSTQNPGHTYEKPDISPIVEPYYIWDMVVFDVTLSVTSIHGCTDDITKADTLFLPTALLMADVAQGCAPLTVTFSDSSVSNEDIVSWHWFFGDGTDSLITNSTVTYIYQTAGEYDAYLVITNSRGCTDTSFSIRIVAGNQPSPNFTVSDPVVCADEEVTLIDLTPASDLVDTWHYNTDDNHSYACQDEQNPTWAFNYGTGPMDVTLTVGYNGCYADTIISGIINVLGPLGKLSYTCSCDSPYVFNFIADNSDVDSMAWDFGDSTFLFTTTETNPRHVYDTTGDYQVILTTFNSASGCAPYSDTVEIKVRDIKAEFFITDFTIADSILCAGVPYTFDASGSEDVHEFCNRGYRWDFEDASPPKRREDPVISHSFLSAGIHDVRLIVRDENYCEDTTYKRVKVYGVQSDFSADSMLGCIPLPVNFTDQSTADTTITGWNWSFGDLNFSSDTNPSHIYTTPGIDSFLVILVVTDIIGCSNIAADTIRISVPNADFASQARITCGERDTVSFIPFDPTHSAYIWSFGDGDSSFLPMPEHPYDAPGNYSVTLAVTDTLGCSNTSARNVFIFNPEFPEAGFETNVDTLEELCFPLLVNFTDTSIISSFASRSWDLGTGNPVVPLPSIGTLYGQPGTYEVELIVRTTFGCADTATRSLVIGGPSADFTLSPNTICKGQDITFTIVNPVDVESFLWDFGDGTGEGAISPVVHTYDFNPPSGQTIAQLIYWSTDSTCPKAATKTVNIHPVIADFDRNGELTQSDTVHCLGDTDFFTNTSLNADAWSWDFGDGTTASGGNSPAHTFTGPGLYNVQLAVVNNSLGCEDTIVKTMLVYANPNINAQGGDICEGDTIQLVASGGDLCVWDTDPSLSDTAVCNPFASPTTTTDYFVTITDANGCNNDTFIQVIVYETIPERNEEYTIIIGDTVHLDATQEGEGYTYLWSPDYEISCMVCPDPVVMPLEDTTYTVDVLDPIGCDTVTFTYKFIVKPVTTISVPTAFTPNGDNRNERIHVDGWGIKSLIEFKIFNRWGQMVFDAPSGVDPADLQAGWDGHFNGKLQDMDTYFYVASVESWVEGQQPLTKKGSFHLLK